jgi:hypothetical protein
LGDSQRGQQRAARRAALVEQRSDGERRHFGRCVRRSGGTCVFGFSATWKTATPHRICTQKQQKLGFGTREMQ